MKTVLSLFPLALAAVPLQAQFAGSGLSCSANPIITVSNGDASVALSGSTLANDTGPVSISFVAVYRSR